MRFKARMLPGQLEGESTGVIGQTTLRRSTQAERFCVSNQRISMQVNILQRYLFCFPLLLSLFPTTSCPSERMAGNVDVHGRPQHSTRPLQFKAGGPSATRLHNLSFFKRVGGGSFWFVCFISLLLFISHVLTAARERNRIASRHGCQLHFLFLLLLFHSSLSLCETM